MSVITATLEAGDDVSTVIADLLRRFPKGSRLKLAISEIPPTIPIPSLDLYRQAVATARRGIPNHLWKTTAEAMSVLREGEAD